MYLYYQQKHTGQTIWVPYDKAKHSSGGVHITYNFQFYLASNEKEAHDMCEDVNMTYFMNKRLEVVSESYNFLHVTA